MKNSENCLHSLRTGLQKIRLGENTNSVKLTKEQVLEIRELYSNGMRQVKLAKMYNITQAGISLIIKRINWSHI